MHLRLLAAAPALAGAFVLPFGASAANPEVGAAIIRQFGEAQLQNVLLVVAPASESEPVEWKVYSRDPYRPGELLRSAATNVNGRWEVTPAGAGKVLDPVPSQRLDFKRLTVDSREARRIVTRAAARARVTFARVGYQLVANNDTGRPEWGLALEDGTGFEVGFCVVSGATGALISQDWTPRPSGRPRRERTRAERQREQTEELERERRRRAWRWVDRVGRSTGGRLRDFSN